MNNLIQERFDKLKEEIRQLSEKISPDASGAVRIVLVSKFVETAWMLEAYSAGARDFGENHAQELRDKKDDLPKDVRLHMIGRLQTNKIKYVVGNVVMIHSLDRIEIAEEIQRQASKRGIESVDCLIQVNSSQESQKGGVLPEETKDFARSIMKSWPAIRLRGLMTVGPDSENKELVRGAFKLTARIFKELKEEFPEVRFDTLSMGMSSDYRIAIEEGSTLVRIGSAVFGPRHQ